jgi:hypothetical protein
VARLGVDHGNVPVPILSPDTDWAHSLSAYPSLCVLCLAEAVDTVHLSASRDLACFLVRAPPTLAPPFATAAAGSPPLTWVMFVCLSVCLPALLLLVVLLLVC